MVIMSDTKSSFIGKFICTALALFALWVLGYCAFSIHALSLSPEDPDTKTDAIIVLTGGKGRIAEGLQLLVDNKAPQLFITGVHPHVTAKDITKIWTGEALLPCCITLGYEARSTVQNAQETKAWLAKHNHKTIRMVTGNFHMMRARYEFEHALPDTKIITHSIVQPRFGIKDHMFWRMSFVEYHKNIIRRISLLLRDDYADKSTAGAADTDTDTDTGINKTTRSAG